MTSGAALDGDVDPPIVNWIKWGHTVGRIRDPPS
jgi:hypothetical protein